MPLGAILYKLYFDGGLDLEDDSADEAKTKNTTAETKRPISTAVTFGEGRDTEESSDRPWTPDTTRKALCPSPDIRDPRYDDNAVEESRPADAEAAERNGGFSSYDPFHGDGRASSREPPEDPPMLSSDILIPPALEEPTLLGESEELIKSQEELRNDITELADVIRSSTEKDKKVEFHIQTLFHSFPDPEQVVDYFLCIIRAFTEPDTPDDLKDVAHRIRIAKQVKRLLLARGIDEMAEVDRFVISIMKEQLVDPSFLTTLNMFNFFRINPIVIVDFLAHTSGGKKYEMLDQLTDFLSKFTAADMRDTLEEIVKFAQMRKNEVAENLRALDAIFPEEYPHTAKRQVKKAEMMEMVCGELNLCQLARDICLRHENLALDVDCPVFARHRIGQHALADAAKGFANGTTEMLDLCGILHDIVNKLGFDSLWLVQNLLPVYPKAAEYLRVKYVYSLQDVQRTLLPPATEPPTPVNSWFHNPSCNKNRRLHSLIDGLDEYDLSDHKRLVAFMTRVQSTDIIAAVLHTYKQGMLKVFDAQMLTIRVQDAIGFLPFSLIEDISHVHNCFRMLNKTRGTKRIFMRNPAELLKYLDEWNITSKTDLVSVQCKNGSDNLNAMSREVTDGDMCLRASRFILTRDTSNEAYRHQKLMASMVYAYAVKHAKKLQGNQTVRKFYNQKNRAVEGYNPKLSQANKNKAKQQLDRKAKRGR